MGRLAGKVAIISGAAQGMGAATAEAFVAAGAKVVLGDILDEKGAALARKLGDNAHFERLDVREEADWKRVVDAAVSKFGKLDILVNNAAVLHFATTDQLTRSDLQRVLDINVVGMILGVQAATPKMRENGKGVVVNISSVDGLKGCNGLVAYTASKWAVRGITKSMAYEYGPAGIRVVSVHPGGVNTQMGNPMETVGEELQKPYRRVPLQRIGEPAEVARTTLFLCSDEASYITGAEIAVDGGMTAGFYEPALPGAPESMQ